MYHFVGCLPGLSRYPIDVGAVPWSTLRPLLLPRQFQVGWVVVVLLSGGPLGWFDAEKRMLLL